MALAMMMVMLAACGAAPAASPAAAPLATPTAPPTATRAPATATPAPTKPALVDVQSSGLGRPKADWERSYGQPDKNGAYANGVSFVTFTDERVAHLERTWGDRDAKSKPFVLGALGAFMPADKQLVGQVKSSGGTPGDLYRSESLAKVFPPERFINGEPGEFIILFRTRPDGMITAAIVGLGNNP
jgi:hypothetical protein